MEHRAAGGEGLAAFGHVPADDLHDDVALADAELEVILLLADDPGLADDLEPAGDEQGLGIADPVGLEPIQLLDDAQGEDAERDLGVDQ